MSIVLRVNSKYKEANETDANFRYHLVSSPAVASVTSLSLISFTMNRLFTNIYAANDTICILDGVLPIYITIPWGQYTATELASTLSTTVSALLPSFTFTIVNNQFVVVNSTGDEYTLSFSLSSIATYIGMTQNIVLLTSAPATFPSYPQLQGPDEIYVQSSIMASGQCLDEETLGGSIPLLAAIPCANVPYGFSVNYNAPQMEQHTVYTDNGNPSQLKTIFIQLTDKFGNLLNIPPNCYADILFRVTFQQ